MVSLRALGLHAGPRSGSGGPRRARPRWRRGRSSPRAGRRAARAVPPRAPAGAGSPRRGACAGESARRPAAISTSRCSASQLELDVTRGQAADDVAEQPAREEHGALALDLGLVGGGGQGQLHVGRPQGQRTRRRRLQGCRRVTAGRLGSRRRARRAAERPRGNRVERKASLRISHLPIWIRCIGSWMVVGKGLDGLTCGMSAWIRWRLEGDHGGWGWRPSAPAVSPGRRARWDGAARSRRPARASTDRSDRVRDGRVIAVEAACDLGEGHAGQLAREVHGHLPGARTARRREEESSSSRRTK